MLQYCTYRSGRWARAGRREEQDPKLQNTSCIETPISQRRGVGENCSCHPEAGRWLQTRQTSILNGPKRAKPIWAHSLLQIHATHMEDSDKNRKRHEQSRSLEKPLLFNPFIQFILLSSVSIRKCLLGNSITKMGHLLNEEGWIPTKELKAVTGLRSSHLAAKLQEELCNTIPSSYRSYIGQRNGAMQDKKSDEEFPGLRILPPMRTEEEDEVTDSILSFKAPQTEERDLPFYCKSARQGILKETESLKVARDVEPGLPCAGQVEDPVQTPCGAAYC